MKGGIALLVCCSIMLSSCVESEKLYFAGIGVGPHYPKSPV